MTLGDCVTFYYHMYGATIGTLNVYSQQPGQVRKIFTQTGNQGNKWIMAQASVPSTKMNYTLGFEGIIGTGYTGDISIDDISVSSGLCPSVGE